ncbi:hypothetical protein LDENG_00199030 [Lucifuga dentata]|nr:hypothetical protein LDENG_00199030 [Lucifuga dentata]
MAASLLVLVLNVFSADFPPCPKEEYRAEQDCCRMCHRGSHVRKDCEEFSSTSCQPCAEGTYMDEPNRRRQCFDCVICNEGSGLKKKKPCTTTSNTVCEPLEGFFCTEQRRYGCMAAQQHRRCSPGQYINQTGTAQADTVCISCTGETFSDGTFTSCRPHTECEYMNLRLKTAGTNSADAECEEQSSNTAVIEEMSNQRIYSRKNRGRCFHIGKLKSGRIIRWLFWWDSISRLKTLYSTHVMFSALLIFGCLAACSVPGRCCRPEEYLTASNGQCCPMCHEGTVVKKDCEPDSGTQCVSCESGTFMNKANGLNKCFPCTSCDRGLDANQRIIVGDGLFAKRSCNPKNDVICDVLNGHYCISFNEETGCSLAEKHKRCTPGQRIKEAGTRKSDTVCEDCQPGHFSQDGVDCIAQTM